MNGICSFAPVMIQQISIAGYRSICDLQVRLKRLNVVRGPNGSGKSNLYKALRLLARTAQGGLPQAIAQEGGMPSVLWAGRRKKKSANEPVRLKLAAHSDEFNYEVRLGLPEPPWNAFRNDPEVKEEYVWMGQPRRAGNTYFERTHGGAWVMDSQGHRASYSGKLNPIEPVLAQVREPHLYPELSILSRGLQEWRFYDHFRSDPESPLRQPQPSTRSPILSHDGLNLAGALQTIREVGDAQSLQEFLEAVFPEARLHIVPDMIDAYRTGCIFGLELELPGVGRHFKALEFSDGTIRYLCLLAALLSLQPPPLLVLNEPENSLHPDVLEPLAALIRRAAERSQVWVTTHSDRLADLLAEDREAKVITLEKINGETRIVGQGLVLRDD